MFCECFVCVFVFAVEIVDHGHRWGDTAQELAQWRHLVSSSVALDVLYWARLIVLYHCIAMAIKTANDLAAFFVVVRSVVGHNHS